MKIAIAAPTTNAQDAISRRGARAECYLVFDESGGQLEAIQNPFKDYDRAVGVRVADYLAERGISVVAAAHLGNGFTTALEAKGILDSECEGTVSTVARELAARFGAL